RARILVASPRARLLARVRLGLQEERGRDSPLEGIAGGDASGRSARSRAADVDFERADADRRDRGLRLPEGAPLRRGAEAAAADRRSIEARHRWLRRELQR